MDSLRKMGKVVPCTRQMGEKKYWLSWELNPDHLPSACKQQDLLGRGLTIRPLCLVDVSKGSECLNISFSLLLACSGRPQSDYSK